MINNFNNEKWDVLIKSAVIENSFKENASYPTNEQLEQLEIPIQYDRNLKQFIKNLYKHDEKHSFLSFSKKIASILLILLGISFFCLLQSYF